MFTFLPHLSFTQNHVEEVIAFTYIDEKVEEVSKVRTYIYVSNTIDDLPVSAELRNKVIENINQNLSLGEEMVEASAEVISIAMEGLTISIIIIMVMGIVSELVFSKQGKKGKLLGAISYGLCNLVLACVLISMVDLFF